MAKPLECQWKLAVDKREQQPWTFEDVYIGAGKDRRLLVIESVPKTIKSGDYSIVGYEDQVAIERKSKADLFSTIGSGRARFVRELARLDKLKWAAVIIECEWYDAMMCPPERSEMSVSSIDGSINAWTQRFPGVHWFWRPGRYIASKVCYKLLQRFYEDNR
jgi:ERCC4-type nuclease